MSIFEVALESFIDMNHELVLLSKQIDWEAVESEFAEYYCADNGRPSVPIRKMVGMMLLKNITFPTDAKLYRKIIAKVLKMARKEDIELRQTYTRELKALKLKVRFMNHPTRMKEGKKAVKRIRTIARAMVSDIARKMDDHQLSFYGKDLALFVRVINQERSDKDKVYSLHEPEVQCISKGKEHKKYEFGNKSAIAKTRSGLIVSALAFIGNPYDGHTISAHLEQTTG